MLIALGMVHAAPAIGQDVGALPPMQMQNGITYVTGGFGVSESSAMKNAAGRYDLMLTFAERDGSYVADVGVQIIASNGDTVLDTVSGPLLLASLPAGEYRVRADYNGMSRWQTVSVDGRRHRSVAFTWPNEVGGDHAIGGGAELSAVEARSTSPVQGYR